MRIKKGTYGICVATGEPIEKGRLEIVPHTNYSVEAKLKGLKRRN
jgi:RNA polymerase-binding transcription factor DksA